MRAIDEVDNCDSCPFSFRSVMWRCMHPANRGGARKLKVTDADIEAGHCPGWCPLKTCQVIVRWRGRPAPARQEGE